MSPKALIAVALTVAFTLVGRASVFEDKAELNKDAQAALASLYAKVPKAKALGAKAIAILVFPKVTKAGLGIGGLHGDGVLIKGGQPVAYYDTSGGSFGLQAGVQTYGYALFFNERERFAAARQGRRIRDRCRSERGRHRRGRGETNDDHHRQG